MITALSTYARAGALALGVLTGLSGGVVAAPIGLIDRPQPPSAATAVPIVPVAEGELRGRFGGQAAVNDYWRRGSREFRGNREWRGNRGWRGDRREWRRGNREWRGDRGWRESRRDWRRGNREWRHDRRWDRRWNRRDYYRDRYRSGIYLGFGAPFYGGYYNNYYDPGYVAPRPRYYAPAGGSAHTRWCYNRYRSYRAWDNTYQPYGGPRRQCISPYV